MWRGLSSDNKKSCHISQHYWRKNVLLLRNLLTPALPKEKTFDDIVSTLNNHFELKPARNCGTFGSDETVAQYIEELRMLSTNLRDHFVCGLKVKPFKRDF